MLCAAFLAIKATLCSLETWGLVRLGEQAMKIFDKVSVEMLCLSCHRDEANPRSSRMHTAAIKAPSSPQVEL